MMAQMGIKSTEMTDVKEVIFRGGKEKDYVISDAQVIMIEAQGGQKTFQVSGTIKEVKKDTAASKATEQAAPFSEDDIKLVMEQAHVTREKAIEALKAADGEPAQAIVNLTGS
ncbi:nascent polypeptide-associated complex protein [Thermogymnomonas acidicola]|uniref:nascent polypeptide-associated complex protein n=1 Tax=Thermogymnomonas acidicola TaxID=399579 RepID=UPI0009468173|nr:nascent polypeptide-associated complex protein [Thermogymnomonas acidicola]